MGAFDRMFGGCRAADSVGFPEEVLMALVLERPLLEGTRTTNVGHIGNSTIIQFIK